MKNVIDPKIRVLVIDDLSTMRAIVTDALRQLEIEGIEEAEDGFTALMKIRKIPYDVILLDWNMPKMSGLQVLKEIRANTETKDVPVIMLTSEASASNIVAAIKAGVNDYIIKPFTVKVLEEKLTRALNKNSA